MVFVWIQIHLITLVFAHKLTFNTEADEFSVIYNSRQFNFNLQKNDSLVSVAETTAPTMNGSSTTEVTTVETTTRPTTTQYLMYTMMNSQTIYSYTFDFSLFGVFGPVKNGQITIPYSTYLPALVFNDQLGFLEIIGDTQSSRNYNHKWMTPAGKFRRQRGSLFNGDYDFEVCYSQNAGTLVFSGYGHSGATQVYIITQNSNWNQVENSDKYLSSFQNPGNSHYIGFGVVEHDDMIYLMGGYSTSGSPIEVRNEIQVLNLKNSESLQESQTRQWSFMTSLKNAVYGPAVIYSNDQLLVVGETECIQYSQQYTYTCRDVQYLSLASNTTGVHAGTIEYGNKHRDDESGLAYPGMYHIPGGNVSIFGGASALDSCIQQTSLETDLDSEWNCLSSSESALEGLKYFGGDSTNIRFSNFVV